MVRSMYSGVAGMKSHQYRMDAIGNNISNVNTYGFKSSRATFRDVYYQAVNGASEPSGNRGGVNPSGVGYGSQISSIDVLHAQSTFQNTGNPMDVAISGEGFLQVQDADGNIYYTKAGMLYFDATGNLVDNNGNFVLGVSGSPVGKAADKQKIQISLPSAEPKVPSTTETLNNIAYTIKGSKETEDGNVNFTFMASSTMPEGLKAEAIVTNSGITVTLNASAKFKSLEDMMVEVNKAILKGNGGVEHPGGTFTISSDPEVVFPERNAAGDKYLTGAEIVGDNFGVKRGKLSVPAKIYGTGWSIDSVEPGFTAGGVTMGETPIKSIELEYLNTGDTITGTDTADEKGFKMTVNINGKEYVGFITVDRAKQGSGSVVLKDSANEDDAFIMNYPSLNAILSGADAETAATPGVNDPSSPNFNPKFSNVFYGEGGTAAAPTIGNATASAKSLDLGFKSKGFLLKNGTAGGPQSMKDLSGISIGGDGVIVGYDPLLDPPEVEIGRIDLAVFDNNNGLVQSGDTYFTTSKNSGEPNLCKPGLGGAGEIKSSALEMSNVDLSQEFSDMIVTQRGFQANGRIITVSDTMLEELINLKR